MIFYDEFLISWEIILNNNLTENVGIFIFKDLLSIDWRNITIEKQHKKEVVIIPPQQTSLLTACPPPS